MTTPVVTETEIKKAQKEWATFTKAVTISAIIASIVTALVVAILVY